LQFAPGGCLSGIAAQADENIRLPVDASRSPAQAQTRWRDTIDGPDTAIGSAARNPRNPAGMIEKVC